VTLRTSGVVLRTVFDELLDQLELRHLDVWIDVDGIVQLTEVHRIHCVAD